MQIENSEMSGKCSFHLAQSWFRQIQGDKFLLREYLSKEDTPTGKWLKYFFGLPYLPPEEILDGFIDIMSAAPPGITENFSRYISENYILFARFPPELRARPPSAVPRVTNDRFDLN